MRVESISTGRGLTGLHRRLLTGAAFLFAAAATPAAGESLPVFKLAAPAPDTGQSSALFNSAFGQAGTPSIRSKGALQKIPGAIAGQTQGALSPTDTKASETNYSYTLQRGRQMVEIDRRSGFVFLADFDQLWNVAAKPKLPADPEAQRIADSFVESNKLLPAQEGVAFKFSHLSETAVSGDGEQGKTVLDRQVNYAASVLVGDRAFPVVGGGGDFKVTIGDQGRVIGASGGWRSVSGMAENVEIVPAETAIETVRKNSGGAKLGDLKADLAYYAEPGFKAQQFLAPVWVVRGTIDVGGRASPMRIQIVPATAQFGPVYPAAPKAQPRKLDLKKNIPKMIRPQKDEEGRGASLFDLVIPPAYAQSGKECGTSWIGLSGGLGGSAGNRQGFKDHCSAAGWSINFDWGDANAFETDWRRDDDLYVDAADLVFYTGHASPWGWSLSPPQDGDLNNGEVGGAADIYGNLDLEWVIIAACGPHQSNHYQTNIDNAFDRWRTIFDGLHVFAGYGAVTFDNTDEGRRFMELARAGWSVVDAWFRTGQEIQPSTNGYEPPNGDTIYVTAMWAHNGNHCARNERIHGVGPTCPDVTGAGQQRHLMWSGT